MSLIQHWHQLIFTESVLIKNGNYFMTTKTLLCIEQK